MKLVPPGGGEVVGDSPERRVEILSDHDSLHATWSRFGPGREGADLHVHRRHTDLFYVLDGELTIRLGVEDEAVPVPAGSLARVPPMVVHGFRNASEREVRYLNFHAPGQGFADFMRALRDGRTFAYDQEPPPGDGIRPASDAVIEAAPVRTEVEAIAVSEVSLQPGEASGTSDDDRLRSLYVLEGELVLTAGARELVAPAGAWVRLAPGAADALSVLGAEPVRLLDVRSRAVRIAERA
jgi:uncharacterized cupin superfamily protein